MLRSLILSVLVLGLSSMACADDAMQMTLETPRGKLHVAINTPKNLRDRAPTVIIAPGQGYHMGLPIIAGLAEKLAQEGVIAYRFNWVYFSNDPVNGNPSENLSKEVEDMEIVTRFALSNPQVDATRIVVAGKSLGSLVAYQVFQKERFLAKAVALLTPICTQYEDSQGHELPTPIASGPANYPGPNTTTRPVFLAVGKADPLCLKPMLQDFLNHAPSNVTLFSLEGGHSWEVSKGTDPDSVKRNAENVEYGVQNSARWIHAVLTQ